MSSKRKTFVEIDDPLIVADLLSETIGGGTNAVCALGNGALTAGISPWGELVYFRWPNPSYYDHLRYVTDHACLVSGLRKVSDVRYGSDAPSLDWRKYGRPYEKYRGLGAKSGVRMGDGTLLWQDEPVWDSSRRYEPEWGHLLVTELTNNENHRGNPVSMTLRQWVMPHQDLLVQHFSIDSPGAESLFYHATFAPWMTVRDSLHNEDSSKAGFAAVYCPDEDVMVWFYPGAGDRKRIARELAGINSVSDLHFLCDDGIFIIIGASVPATQFQVGADTKGRRGGGDLPVGGRRDAGNGTLEGNRYHRGHVDGALKFALSEKNRREVTVYTAVAGTAMDACEYIESARVSGPDVLGKNAEKIWKREVDSVAVAEKAAGTPARVGRRAVLNLLLGRDRGTGAIVASPARQPRYACDWPRDGAFYDMVLDLAGFPETVDHHLDFYRKTQRREKTGFSITWLASFKSPFYRPRGHWYANMNSDGSPGFFKIIPVEIDETSLMVWDIWRHLFYVPEERKLEYRDRDLPVVAMAMEGILPYVDLRKGWTRKIMEDDDYIAKNTLHGASAVLAGLASGAALAEEWEMERDVQEQWRNAAVSLREGMLRRVQDPAVLDSAGWRGIQWSLFPAPLFRDYNDPLCAPFLARLEEDMTRKVIQKQGGVGYLGEQLFIYALAVQGISGKRAFLEQVLRVLTEEAPVEGTDCFGELGLWLDHNGKRIIQNRTSIPHLWNGVTAYLSLYSLYEPETILRLRPPL